LKKTNTYRLFFCALAVSAFMAIVCAVLVSMLLADIDESTVVIFSTYFAIFAAVFFVVECVVGVSLYILVNDYITDVGYLEAALLGIVAGSPSVFLAGTLGLLLVSFLGMICSLLTHLMYRKWSNWIYEHKLSNE